MHVSLTPRLEDYVREKVAAGLYNNNSEVVREALRLMAENELIRRRAIERALQVGEDDLAAGRYTTYEANEIDKLLEDCGWPSGN